MLAILRISRSYLILPLSYRCLHSVTPILSLTTVQSSLVLTSLSAVSFPLPWERKKKHRLNKYKIFFYKKEI
nr:MAG TPA: hypothetical protein [Caudoviricetes sp.]